MWQCYIRVWRGGKCPGRSGKSTSSSGDSPGVSLYSNNIRFARDNGVQITSLLNLWFAEEPDIATIAVTGTKGKSTTASLIAHILKRLGRRVALAGNIGVPVTEITDADYAVIEVSSYQAADFDGVCDFAVLTSLYPEHTDWHLTVERYVRDKINLLSRSRRRIVNCAAAGAVDLDHPRRPAARVTCSTPSAEFTPTTAGYLMVETESE